MQSSVKYLNMALDIKVRSDSSTSPAYVWLGCKFRKKVCFVRLALALQSLRSDLVASGEVQPITNTCALILKMPSSFYWLGSLWPPRLPHHSGGKQNHIGIKLVPFHPFIRYYLTKPMNNVICVACYFKGNVDLHKPCERRGACA